MIFHHNLVSKFVLFLSLFIQSMGFLCRRINMAGLGPKTVPHLVDAMHAAVTTLCLN